MRILKPATWTMLAVAGVVATACTPTPSAPAKPATATPPQMVEKPVTAAAAANMAANCFACHGPNGVSPGAIPSLATLTNINISEMLKAFKNGHRPSTVMGRHAKGYTNTEIDAIAIYIATLNGNYRNN